MLKLKQSIAGIFPRISDCAGSWVCNCAALVFGLAVFGAFGAARLWVAAFIVAVVFLGGCAALGLEFPDVSGSGFRVRGLMFRVSSLGLWRLQRFFGCGMNPGQDERA